MPTVVPESVRILRPEGLTASLGEALDALLEFTGATAGWVGLAGTSGRLTFPVSRGLFSPAWLTTQQGQGVWGFAIREGPTLLNDLPDLPALGEPALANLLSCPITVSERTLGHVLLANKPSGFTSHDSSILLGMAHLMGKWMSSSASRVDCAAAASAVRLLGRALDHAAEGVLVMDDAGTLVFTNATWSSWSGFSSEELKNHEPPFPFWISHRELPALDLPAFSSPPVASGAPRSLGVFPFRHRSGTIFWCQMSTVADELDGRPMTIAFLHKVEAKAPVATPVALPSGAEATQTLRIDDPFAKLAKEIPFALALTDQYGTLRWTNPAFDRSIGLGREAQGQPLREYFTGLSAAALEHLFRGSVQVPRGQVGRLALERVTGEPSEPDLIAYWLAVRLEHGPGFLFVFSDDWETLCPPDDLAAAWQRELPRPRSAQLALLLDLDGEVRFWDERWESLTGLSAADLTGISSEVVLDWLLPRQVDRDRVADLLHQPLARTRQGFQAMMEVLNRVRSRPMECTFLPLLGEERRRWLLLVGEQDLHACEITSGMALVRHFARGLSHLLNHYLSAPLGVAELASERTDLPPKATTLFEQVLGSCQRLTRLIGLLQDLSATMAGDTQLTSLAELVHEFLDEDRAVAGKRSYELKTDLHDAGELVRINRRMMKTVLHELLTNAEQALANSPRPRIEVRVVARADAVFCEIEDTGEGLPEKWTHFLSPFHSTKGPFARDAAHAALEGTGLGLSVCQHLLSLHGGRLELRSKPGEGTTAIMLLPSAKPSIEEAMPDRDLAKRVRLDAPDEGHEVHATRAITPSL